MELTVVVRPSDRTVIFSEAHALVAGDVYSPLVVDFSDLEELPSDGESVQVSLARSRGEAPFVAVTLSAVEGHRCLRSGTLSLRTQAMASWYADRRAEIEAVEAANESSPGRAEVPGLTTLGWLVIESSSTVYAACEVPVVLRSFSASGSGADGGYYTTDAVDGMLSDVYSTITEGLGSEADARSAADSALSARIDGVSAELPSLTDGYATEEWVSSRGYLTSHQPLGDYAKRAELSAYARSADIPSLSGYATEEWVSSRGYLTSVPDAFATRTWVSDRGYVTASGLSGALSSYARSSDIPSVSGFLTASAAADTYLSRSDAASSYVSRGDLDPDSVATKSWVSSGFVASGGLSDYLLSATAASVYLTRVEAASAYLSRESASAYARSSDVAASYLSRAEAASYATSTELASSVSAEEAARMFADSSLSSDIDAVEARVSVLESSSGPGSPAMRLVALPDGDSVALAQSSCNHVTASPARSALSVSLPPSAAGYARGCSLAVSLPSGWSAASLTVTVLAGGATLVYDGSWRSGSAVPGAAAGSVALFVFNEVASGVVAVSSRVYAP